MDLKLSLESYRNITIELIKNVKKGEDLNTLLQKREDIIESIKNIDFTNEEFKEFAKSFKIMELDEELKKSITNEKEKVKEKLKILKITREARMKYENTQFKPTFFNKKI